MAQHHDALGTPALVVRRKTAADDGLMAEHPERVRGDPRPSCLLGPRTIAADVHGAVPVCRDVGERSALLAPLLKLGMRDGGMPTRSQLPIEHVQAAGIVERQGPEEGGVDDGEHRGVDANAEREGQHGDGRVPAFLHKQPKREPEILEHGSPLAKTPVRRAG